MADVPVGVALALRHKKELIQNGGGNLRTSRGIQSPEPHFEGTEGKAEAGCNEAARATSSAGPSLRNRKERKGKRNAIRKPKRNPSLQIFMEATCLYLACLLLPNVIGYFRRITAGIVCSLSPTLDRIFCALSNPVLGDSATESNASTLADALAPDAGISDFGIVVLLSISMAVVRVGLVHFLVPRYLEQPQRLEALVRCKSVHLLSASYSGTITPRQSFAQERDMKIAGDLAPLLPPMPILYSNDKKNIEEDDRLIKEFSDKIMLNPRKYEDEDDAVRETAWMSPNDSAELEPAPAVSSGLISSASAQSLQVLLQQATPARVTPIVSEAPAHAQPQRMDRLFAAPRYATAMFRLLYCTGCIIIGAAYFSDAKFWPPAVGGKGSTKRCWDLSSLGTVIMDQDFDDFNPLLRRYFLVQASYHFHSAAFHIVAEALLWTVTKRRSTNPPNDGTRKKKWFLGIISARMMTVQNFQSIILHSIAVGLLAFGYLFSSLRRLAAIGIFAFDVSSWFLHLMQLCLSAKRPVPSKWVWVLHKLLVLPSFIYSRFYVFPLLGYSSLYESEGWLRQLENVTVPGVSTYMKILFMAWLSVLMVWSVIHLRRLVVHPHVLQAMGQKKQH